MEIPQYPEFTALDLAHKEFFDAAFKKCPPEISEFTFTNLFSWRKAYGYKVSLLGESLILRCDTGEKARFMQPIGTVDSYAVIERILHDAQGVFIRIPENTAKLFESNRLFEVREDRNNADYLYLSSELINLSGRKYDGKRNQIKRFKSEFDYAYADSKGSDVEYIMEFEEAWCALKGCDYIEGLNNERQALREITANFEDFKLKAGVIKIKGKIRAVAIAEMLNPETLLMHMLKADPAIAGLYQVLLNDFLRVHGQYFKYVNLEQDLGIAGLRASKESYHPLTLIKKYIITLKL